jgi:hypothetical protein
MNIVEEALKVTQKLLLLKDISPNNTDFKGRFFKFTVCATKIDSLDYTLLIKFLFVKINCLSESIHQTKNEKEREKYLALLAEHEKKIKDERRYLSFDFVEYCKQSE